VRQAVILVLGAIAREQVRREATGFERVVDPLAGERIDQPGRLADQ
jgi:hypothetical protein